MKTDLKNKVILTDCDGVLLDWINPFTEWMTERGYSVVDESAYSIDKHFGIPWETKDKLVKRFNESSNMIHLPELRDSVEYVNKLHFEHGFEFHLITSMSKNKFSHAMRKENLKEVFGLDAFGKFVFLDSGEDKDQELFKYWNSGCWWVEDKYKNALVGKRYGLNPILVGHDFNENIEKYDETIPRLDTWKEIYELITG